MPAIHSFNDYRPVTWFRRMPVYVTTILVAVLTLGMFATVIMESSRVSLATFGFLPAEFFRGNVWQVLTYSLIAQPDFFFLFGMFFLYASGIEVEKYLGRTRFIQLLALLLLVPPLVLSLWSAVLPVGRFVGAYDLILGLFIAFATLYPNIEYLGWVPLKWIAFACIAIASMSHLPVRDWTGLSVLWATCAASFGAIRFLQRGGSAEWWNLFPKVFSRRPKFRVVPKPTPEEDALTSIDPLLDKIAKRGISSLTASERSTLERAREALV